MTIVRVYFKHKNIAFNNVTQQVQLYTHTQ